ncbi:MAG: ABC transporter substrate-binding protein [candidate division Zixibacteria bacterium]|nr:ABC transporter substrate-binding protein [candidate division Zixibacteria bacterium]
MVYSLKRFACHSRIIATIALSLFVSIAIAPDCVFAQINSEIVVVQPDSEKSTQRALKGFRKSIREYNSEIRIHLIELKTFSGSGRALCDSILSLSPDVVVTIGSRTTEIVASLIKDIPVIFCAVYHPLSSEHINSMEFPGGNVTGASLDILPLIQFKYFKRLYPNLKRLGIIYSDKTAKIIPHAKIAANSCGLELVALEIPTGLNAISRQKQTLKAFDSLLNRVEGIWSLADPSVFSPTTTRLMIRKTVQGHVPFMGFSARIVKSGALFALDMDFKDVGRQTGELTVRVLKGEDPGSIPITRPGIIWFHFNRKTAKHIAANIPEDLRTIAKGAH